MLIDVDLCCSTSLGAYSNSPSALFVASDGQCLRLFQAVIDARSLLLEKTNNNHTAVGDKCISTFLGIDNQLTNHFSACFPFSPMSYCLFQFILSCFDNFDLCLNFTKGVWLWSRSILVNVKH